MSITQLQGIQLSLFSTISLFGIIQGIIISGLLLFNKKYDIPTKKYMAMLILVCISINAFELIYRLKMMGASTPFWILPISFFPLMIPATYFILKYYVTLDSKVKTWEYSLYLPFCFALLHEISTGMKYLSGNLDNKAVKLYSDIDDYIMLNLEFINGIICLIIFRYFYLQIRKRKEEILNNFPNFTPKSLAFLSISLLVGIVLALTSTLIAFTEFSKESTATLTHDRTALELGITILINYFTYGLIIHPELFTDTKKHSDGVDEPIYEKQEYPEKQEMEQENEQEEEIETLQPANNLSDNTEIYHERLLMLMQEKAPYRDPDFNLESLAHEMNLSKSYLSKIINQKEGKNFFEFINHYRIEEVKQKLMDESFDHFSIIAIALEAGFKSKSTFNTAFKKVTGLPPSKFKKKRKSKTY